MRFHVHSFATLPNAADKIISLIRKKYFVGSQQYDAIRAELTHFFQPFRKELFVFIEYPYVDKVYRDSYYHYFSTKYREYQRDSIRLSFFNPDVQKKHVEDSENISFLDTHFLGYCILRPTFPNVIGRNLISKKALRKPGFVTCIHKESPLINGLKLHIEGFPHSSQDQENITCAETTVWAIMEYFGHKYAEYKPVLPSIIINRLNEHSDKRMLPSNGLTVEQISFALKDFGFGTLIYTEDDDGENFIPNLSVYIESGFPVVVHLESKSAAYNHAALMIGRTEVTTSKLMSAFDGVVPRSLIHFSSLVGKYVMQDDNHPPYTMVPLGKPGIHYERGSEYATYKIKSFVVPLYKKMYMEATKARTVFEKIIEDPAYGVHTQESYILRIYMASSRSFKEHIGKQGLLDKKMKNTLLAVAMPRFIWCGEFIKREDAAKGMVSSLIVLDATEASDNWSDSFIFAAHKTKTIFYGAVDHTYKLFSTPCSFSGFYMYDRNLN